MNLENKKSNALPHAGNHPPTRPGAQPEPPTDSPFSISATEAASNRAPDLSYRRAQPLHSSSSIDVASYSTPHDPNSSLSQSFQDAKFLDGPTYRSVGVVDRRALVAASYTPSGARFEMPASLPVGGKATIPNPAHFEKLVLSTDSVSTTTRENRSLSSTSPSPSPSSSSSSSSSKLKTHGLPGVESWAHASSAVKGSCGTSNRLSISAPLEAIATALHNLFKSTSSLDVSFSPSCCKWKIICTLDNAYCHMVVQLFSKPPAQNDGDGYMLEALRREGDCIVFRKVYETIVNTAKAVNEGNKTNAKLKSTQLPTSLNRVSPTLEEIDSNPVTSMAASNKLDQLLYASQVAAKLVSGGTTESKSSVSKSKLLSNLCSAMARIDLCKPLPYEHAILRHVSYVLATLAEDVTTHNDLLRNDVPAICFRISVGRMGCREISSPDSCAKWTIMDIEARREAARCLSSLLSNNDLIPTYFQDHEYEAWVKVITAVEKEDEQLSMWAQRVRSIREEVIRAR